MRGDAAYLLDILDAAARIDSNVSGQSLESFLSDPMRQDAVLYRLAVIGEAAGRLSKSLRDTQPSIPWRKIIAMRNILVHDYFGTDVEIAWRTATTHVPALATVVREMQRSIPPEGSSEDPNSAPNTPSGTP